MSTSPFLEATIPAPAPADARYIWAKVTQVSPLRIQVDGDRTPLGITPDDLSGGYRPVNQRVYCQILNRRLVVLGPTVDLTPPGVVHEYAGTVLPPGYLWADGSAVSRVTHARLYAALGGASSPWGQGDGSTTFNVPSRKGRVGVGRDAVQTEFDTLAETGGAKTHTLSVAEMPSHSHTQDAHGHTQASHNHEVSGNPSHAFLTSNGNIAVNGTQRAFPATGTSAYFVYAPASGTEVEEHSMTSVAPAINNATATNQNTGGGGAHNNLQPYVVMNYIVKT